jgi:hypothetical protein
MATRFYNQFGEKSLVEPSSRIVRDVWRQIGDSLLECVTPGVYRGEQQITTVLHAAYGWVETRLGRLIRRLASREFMEFVLYQYDLAAELWRSVPDSGNWDELHRESHFASRRRALKHLAEQIAIRSAPEYAQIHRGGLVAETQEAILCADILVTLCMMSDRTHFLVPNHSQLTLFKEYEIVPLRLDSLQPFDTADIDFNRRLIKDRKFRSKCFPNGTADRDFKFQTTILDDCFLTEFGFRYGEFLHVLARILQDIGPAPGSYPIVFCHRDKLLNEIAASARMPISTAKRILSGFTLRSSDMKDEGRKLWNVKQTFRAFRRGFFEVPHPSGPHLAWSNSMADECLDWMVMGIPFKKLPREWLTPKTSGGLDQLSNTVGSWFENQAVRCLSSLGICGSRRKGRIQNGSESIAIPPSVGEIDFLGYSRDNGALVIVECKMVESRMEPRFWKEDIVDFVNAKKSYATKFRIKINWVLENRSVISRVLSGNERPPEIRAVMLTLYPTFAAIHITDFPCVSLAEFAADCEVENKWPYQVGVFPS